MKLFRASFRAALCALLFPFYLGADDVTEAIDEASAAYKAGDFEEAAGMLEYAAGLIRQQRGGNLESLLPAAPDGWETEGPESQAVGAAMFGGGTTASQSYRKGDQSVEITFVGDSPMLQTMGMMFNNPALAASSGMRFKRVNGEKVLVDYEADNESGEATAFLGGKWLVTVSVDGLSQDELLEWVALIDFAKLAQF